MTQSPTTTVDESRIVRLFGFWSAILSAIFYLAFDVAEAMNLSGALTTPYWITITVYGPSLLIALSFVVLMVSLHNSVSQGRMFWTSLALTFAIIYATLNCFIYVIQVLVIAPSFVHGTFDKLALFGMSQDNPLSSGNSPLVAVNALAYMLMSVSTFFASFAIAGKGLNRWARILLRIHGAVAPTVIGALIWPGLILVSATVGITYPIAAILLALVFKSAFQSGRLVREDAP